MSNPLNKPRQQVKPCPQCGETAGWWCKLQTVSMIFYHPTDGKSEERLYEGHDKYCANCNGKINGCVNDK